MPKQTKAVLALATAVITLALIVAGCGGEDEESASGEGNSTEQAFLEAMVPHHESAVAMAEVAQARAQSPEISELANSIISTQEAEIEQMQSIHERLFDVALVPDESSQEQLGLEPVQHGVDPAEELKEADPFDRAFVDEMVPHHESAVQMAEAVLAETDDAELRELAEGIIATQEQEIEQMNAFRVAEFGAPVPESGAHGTEESAPAEPPADHEEGHTG